MARAGVQTLAPVLKKIAPAVISVATKGQIGDGAKKRDIRATGSGVVFDAGQGLIITNNHVIDHADEITVTLADGRNLPAKRVGGDADTDIAVIKIAADNLTAILMGDSDQLEVGDFVLAIGNPLQLGQTVTSGIVSGLRRNNVGIERFEDFIQTDAAIYPGNSGGALVNVRGELVGINTAFAGTSNANPGVGFAIPINMARNVADQIVEFGEIRRGSLGITIDDPTPSVFRELKLPVSRRRPRCHHRESRRRFGRRPRGLEIRRRGDRPRQDRRSGIPQTCVTEWQCCGSARSPSYPSCATASPPLSAQPLPRVATSAPTSSAPSRSSLLSALEIRLVRFRHRLEAVVEMIVVVLRADDLAQRCTVDAPVTLDRVPRRRKRAGILDMDVDLERLACVDHVETLDDVQLRGVGRLVIVDDMYWW